MSNKLPRSPVGMKLSVETRVEAPVSLPVAGWSQDVAAAPEAARGFAGQWAFSVARFLLVAALLAAPVAFGAVQAWAWGLLTVVAVLAVVAWGIGCVYQGTLRIHWSPLFLLASLFIFLGVFQLLRHLTPNPISTRESLLKLTTDLIFFFLTVQCWTAAPERIWRRIGTLVLLYAFLLSVFAIIQFYSGSNLVFWSVESPVKPFGTYVDHDHYAGLMEMLIPISAAHTLSRPHHDRLRILLGFGVLVLIASLLLSGSRGGMIALIGEAVALFVIISLGRSSIYNRRVLLTTVAVGVALAASLFFWMDTTGTWDRLQTVFRAVSSVEARVSFADRKALSRDCLRIFRDHPWIGSGLGSFETVYPQYQSIPGDELWDHAHDDYAEALAETGVVGAVLIVGTILGFLYLAFGNFPARLGCQAGWIQLGAALGCGGLLIHSLVGFNLHIPANAAWFAACAAWATAGRDQTVNHPRRDVASVRSRYGNPLRFPGPPRKA